MAGAGKPRRLAAMVSQSMLPGILAKKDAAPGSKLAAVIVTAQKKCAGPPLPRDSK